MLSGIAADDDRSGAGIGPITTAKFGTKKLGRCMADAPSRASGKRIRDGADDVAGSEQRRDGVGGLLPVRRRGQEEAVGRGFDVDTGRSCGGRSGLLVVIELAVVAFWVVSSAPSKTNSVGNPDMLLAGAVLVVISGGLALGHDGYPKRAIVVVPDCIRVLSAVRFGRVAPVCDGPNRGV